MTIKKGKIKFDGILFINQEGQQAIVKPTTKVKKAIEMILNTTKAAN